MFGASISTNPIGCLRKSLELEPNSIRTRILLGEEFEKMGKFRESLESLESAIRLYPEYEVPYLRVGALLRKLGEESQSDWFFKKAEAFVKNLEDLNNTEPERERQASI